MGVTGLDVINRITVNNLSNNVTVTGSYNIKATDNNVYVNNTSGASVTMTLPSPPAANQELWVKDIAGNAAVYNITISGTIDGMSNPVIGSDYGGVLIKWNGSSWSQKA